MTTALVGTGGTSAVPEFGGSTWVRMQWVLGLPRLGVDTVWVEHLPAIDRFRHHHSLEYLVERFAGTARRFGFADRYCIVYDGGRQHFGLSREELRAAVDDADLLVNLSGKLPLDVVAGLCQVPRRVYVDVDPGFTQVWGRQWPEMFAGHSHFVTTGLAIASARVPAGDVEWRPLPPPVVLEQWPACPDERATTYRTVADWRGSQVAEWEGRTYGGKREEFLRLLPLPERVAPPVELALLVGQHDWADLRALSENGWRIRDPYSRAGDPLAYREYVQCSRAELSVAKGGYVASRSGWISDRTACFLASGKPAVVQSTGLEPHLPTGRGLLTFDDVDQAVEAVEQVEADYLGHSQAARRIAEEHLDSDRVLGGLLERVGL